MEDKDLIKQRIDLAQLISEGMTLNKSGAHYKGLCPFHNEKTPSFMVNPEIGIYKCFGCGKGGDCFSWIMDTEGISFVEALQVLAKRAGVTLSSHVPDQASEERQQILAALAEAREFYHWLLTKHTQGQQALKYLRQRGVTDKTIEVFKLGWAPYEWDGLLKTLIKQGISLNSLIKANLVQPSKNDYQKQQAGKFQEKAKDNTSGGYDRFRGRVMFPLNDPRGQTVGFAGRVLPPEFMSGNMQMKETAKYVNTAETPVFHKRQLLFGLDITKNAIRQTKRAIIVEGELDAIVSWQAGIEEVVAIKGTALTEEQVEVLKRYTETIVLALDMDLAGDQAARRGIQVAEQAGIEVRLVRMTGGKDPADLVNSDPEMWKKLLNESLDIYEFLMESAFERYGTTSATAKRKIVAELVPVWRNISSRVVQAHWVAELARRLTLPESVIWQEVGGGVRQTGDKPVSKEPAAKVSKPRREILEEILTGKLLLIDPAKLLNPEIKEVLTLPWIGRLTELIEKQAGSLEDGEKIEAGKLNLPPELQALTAESMMLADQHDDVKDAPARIAGELLEMKLKEQRHALRQQLGDAEEEGQEEAITDFQRKIDALNLRLAQTR